MSTLGLRDLAFLGGLGGAAPLWTPAQITTALWFDASDSATITTVSGAVSQWNDKSGNARHATQATASLRPSLTTGPAGIRSASASLATPPSLTLASTFTLGGDFTILMVVNRANVSSAIYVPLDANSSSNSNTANQKFMYFTGWSGFNTSLLGGAAPNLLVASFLDSSLFRMQRSGTAGSFLKDASSSSYTFNTTALDIRYIIGGAQANFATDSTTHEIIVCANSLSLTDYQKAEGYLAWKWEIQAKLAADHPYKSAAPTV